jgi:hypothetical protein
MFSAKVIITLIIVVGIGVGTGALIYGILLAQKYSSDPATFTAWGSAILASSVAALVAHLCGGFRDLDNRADRHDLD